MKRILGDRYQLGAMIGTGGMSDVFIADDLRLHREVAVKVLRSILRVILHLLLASIKKRYRWPL